jgi:hypothetical protein
MGVWREKVECGSKEEAYNLLKRLEATTMLNKLEGFKGYVKGRTVYLRVEI